MNKKQILIAVAVFVVGGAIFMSANLGAKKDVSETPAPVAAPEALPTVVAPTDTPADTATAPATPGTTGVKEFAMNSWMETVDGKMGAYFSLKEIVVKKGDKVKITITNTAGTHDFKIDAYNIGVETPLNVPTVVEFTADKVGDFEFYCSKYSHRTIGQTGTLRVTE